MGKLKNILPILMLVLFAISCFPIFFLPFPKRVESEVQSFVCEWEDGTRTQETDFSSISIVSAQKDEIVVNKDGHLGKVKTGKEYARAIETVESGDLFKLFSFRLGDCSRLERMALFELFQDTCLYADEEMLSWDGTTFVPTSKSKFETVYLFKGGLPEQFLESVGATRLILGKDVVFSASDLEGSEICAVSASFPYKVEGDCIFLSTEKGECLIAVLPKAEELTLSCDFLQEGALSACTHLKKITFCKDYGMTLGMLFGASPIPEGIHIEEIF